MQDLDLGKPWQEQTFVAFDIEATGAYPLTSEVVEIGAVKYSNGRIIDQLSLLVQPKKRMSDFIIGIHGITNEMVVGKPAVEQVIDQVRDFFKGSVLIAHHASFDMGFLAVEFEKTGMLPAEPVLCTSLLARVLIHETPNHRLQTLVQHFKIDGGQAHRATDDARACMMVAQLCFQRTAPSIEGSVVTTADLQRPMQGFMRWEQYSLKLAPEPQKIIMRAIQSAQDLDIVYAGGSVRGKVRRITPLGLVRSPSGDWVPARCHIEQTEKRFYLNKIVDIQPVIT